MTYRNGFTLLSGARTTVAAPFEKLLGIVLDRRSEMFFLTLVFFTLAVSVHDAALVVLNNDVIRSAEKNPIGRWLIEANDGKVWLFVIVKLMGTALCGAILLTLYEVWRRAALTAAIAVACFQLVLLIYLSSQ